MSAKIFIDTLINSGFKNFSGVPCSNLGALIDTVIDKNAYITFTNEGDAVAFAAGQYLLGEHCAVFMQNSGLNNAMSPLSSLTELFKIPVLLIIGNRGGDDDEPQHALMTTATTALLDSVNIPHYSLDEINAKILETAKTRTVAVLVNKGEIKANKVAEMPQNKSGILRYNALESIVQNCENSLIFSTTGFTSRELYCIKNRTENFYMVGSMGCVSSLAFGAAVANPSKKIIAIDGDGAFMMRMGAIVTLCQNAPKNLLYIVLDNGAYESTGNQASIKNNKSAAVLPIMSALHPVKIANTVDEVVKIVSDFVIQKSEYTQLYVPIKSGTLPNLLRPDRKEIIEQVARFKEANND